MRSLERFDVLIAFYDVPAIFLSRIWWIFLGSGKVRFRKRGRWYFKQVGRSYLDK